MGGTWAVSGVLTRPGVLRIYYPYIEEQRGPEGDECTLETGLVDDGNTCKNMLSLTLLLLPASCGLWIHRSLIWQRRRRWRGYL